MRIGEAASDVEYRMDEQCQKLSILEIWRIPDWKNSENFLIFQ